MAQAPQPSDASGDGVIWASPGLLIGAQREARVLKQPRGRILSCMSGSYLSPFKGRGMEFDEARPYQPGDDIRNMDWRVTARTSKPHSKVFREERERPVLLWVDFRSSMFFGSVQCFKSVIASRVAALLAWKASQQGDRLGALLFDENNHLEHRPEGGKKATLHVIKQLSRFSQRDPAVLSSHHSADWHTQSQSSAQHALQRLMQVARPGSLIYLISDFRFPLDRLELTLSRLSRHNEPVLIHVSDPLEQNLPASGTYRVTDGVAESMIRSDDERLRASYQQRYVSHAQQLERLSARANTRLQSVSTAQSALDALMGRGEAGSNKTAGAR